MKDENLKQKLADSHIAFLQGPIYALLKYRYLDYREKMRLYNENHIRNKDWDAVSRTQGIVDGINEIIKLTERLDKDILTGNLDVDEALHVIENKVGK